MPKFVFVTGGVLSSLGKGILASSIARLLKSSGVNVSIMKIDPYLNCDAGTLNPFEHGEVFVTQDGFECDLDLGNYERFLGINARREQNMMMGMVYKTIIDNERRGEFLGKTLQLIPHATSEIKRRIRRAAEATDADVLVVEVGGTVGDIESEIVFEAIRQIRFEEEPNDTACVHLALVPTILTGEQKTKPLQHSVKNLLARGLTPDVIVARCDAPLSEGTREKIAQQCNVRNEAVFFSPTVRAVYELPLILEKQGIHLNLAKKLALETRKCDLANWRELVEKTLSGPEVKVAVAGKYATMKDTYMSVFEALVHAGAANSCRVRADLVDSEAIEREGAEKILGGYDAVIVPGGYGKRGVEGKIGAVKYCRTKGVPYLGICYGFQMAVIEIARNVLGWKDANSSEVEPNTRHAVIDLLPEQKQVKDMGGTNRLGAKNVDLKKGTTAQKIYASDRVYKRFRHRYEMNPDYITDIERAGVVFSGVDAAGANIMKVLELPGHPFFFATQYHPEFDSRLETPEPAFNALVKAAKERKGV
ncbi:MAG: CTP synthase [Candidatus Micrarchaeota archaeon]